ncbi:hypothetical protein GFS60_05119 [Rhodococcus sp. WAY2]|nr:hypothetical protein GFS60_05119 [Rhodococcus sp. WAY2]
MSHQSDIADRVASITYRVADDVTPPTTACRTGRPRRYRATPRLRAVPAGSVRATWLLE